MLEEDPNDRITASSLANHLSKHRRAQARPMVLVRWGQMAFKPLCLWCIALRLLSPLFFVVGGSCAPSSLTRVQLFKALWIARKGPVYLIGGLLDTSACLGSIGCGSHAFPLSLSNAAVHTSETCGELLKKSRGRELGSSSVVIYLLFATSYRISPIRFSPWLLSWWFLTRVNVTSSDIRHMLTMFGRVSWICLRNLSYGWL